MKKLYAMVLLGEDDKVKGVSAVETDSPRTRVRENLLMPCYIELPGDDFGKLESLPISAGQRHLIDSVFAAFAAIAEVGFTLDQIKQIGKRAPQLKLNG